MNAPENDSQDHATNPRTSGPQSEPGKLRVRRNARVHGLTARLPDGEEEAAKMFEFADRWVKQIGASTDAEAALIQASAVAHARLERCRMAEKAALKTAGREAVERWEKRKRHAIRKKAQALASDPSNTVAELEESSFGCEWMMKHWLKIDVKLAQGIAIDVQDQSMAMRLLGFHPIVPGPDGGMPLRTFYCLVRLCAGYPAEDLPDMPADLIEARSRLRQRIAEEFDRLEALRLELWTSQDAPQAESIAQVNLIETTHEGQLRQRYRREAFSEMTRGITQVMRLRVERSKDYDREWHHAHPQYSRKKPTSGWPSTAGLPNQDPEHVPGEFVAGTVRDPAPPSANPDSASRPADSRNNPPASVPEPPESRLNPDSPNEMRQPSATASEPYSWRTVPQSPGVSPPSDTPSASPMTPSSGPARAPDDPQRA